MLTKARFAAVAAVLVSVLQVVGCGKSVPADEPLTQVTLALMSVPNDVLCLEVTVTGSTTVTKKVDVAPGTSALITVTGVPIGPATIDEKGYSVACNMVVTGVTQPTWVSAMPASVTLAAGTTTDVTIVLKRPPAVRITNDFQDSPKLTSTPMVVTFAAPVTVGGMAVTQDVVVSNTGTVPAPFAAAMTGSDAAHFSVTTSGCPASGSPMAVGATCTATVRFAPTTAGAKTAHLSLGMPAALLVPVSGTAQVISLAATPATVNFGSVLLASAPAPQVVTVANTGTVPVTFASSLAGTHAALFAVSASTCPASGGMLAVGAMCTLTISHMPSALGAKSATLNVGMPTLATVSLASTVTTPIVATPATVNFNNVTVNTTAPDVIVNVTNTGAAAIPMAVALSGGDAAMFQIATNTCPASLAGMGNCTVALRFTPASIGVKSTTLNLGNPIVTTVAVMGSGVATMLSATPNPVTFPATLVGTAAPVQTVTVTNTGLASAPFATAITGADFSITTNTCGSTLLPGMNCAVTVRFLPATVGAKTGSLNLGNPIAVMVPLSGTGVSAVVALSQPTLPFGNVQTGGPGSTIVLGIVNTGTVNATLAPSVTGTDAAMFTVQTNNCGASLAPGGNCALSIRGLPASAGAKTATLALGTVVNVPLSMTGIATQALSVLPAALAFGTVPTAGMPLAQTVRIVNTSATTVTVMPLAFTGTDAAQFVVDSTSCTAPLPAGGNCSVAVRFMSIAGPRTATLNIGSPIVATVPLSATGAATAVFTTSPMASTTPFSLGNVPVNSLSAPVNVTINNTSGAAQLVALAIAGADPGSFFIQTTTCPTAPATLATGMSCSASIRFAPVATGNKHVNLTMGSPAASFLALTGAGL
jgi:hypothetical protein